MLDIDKQWLEEQYKTQSFAEIAKILGTYPQNVRRTAIKYGMEINDKSEAQKKALKSGRAKHPTEGRERTTKEKEIISESLSKNWDGNEIRRKSHSQKAKELWAGKTDVQKEEFFNLAGKGIRKAAKEGSKVEKFLNNALTNAGFVVEYHKEHMIENDKLHLDIFIPSLSLAIEINGPSHYKPIWGADNLRRNRRADTEKMGLLNHAGISLLRVKCLRKNIYEKTKRDILNKVLVFLKDFVDKKVSDKLIDIEVK